MGCGPESGGVTRLKQYLCGPFSRFGLVVALLAFAADQAMKYWVLYGFDLLNKGAAKVAPGVDFALTWNRGISYGWFQQETELGRWLLLSFKIVVVLALWGWMSQARNRLSALALGLIIGGALGNALDRMTYGAVVDFILLHLDTAGGRFNWYVFNLADAAIVAGVAALLYESLIGDRAAKAP
jgi:signal peptidase II